MSEKELTEAEYDDLIIENSDLVADALRQAGILEPESHLLEIARQFECIDVLFAECRGDELLRLVVVEDKLFRNPQQHREVLAQILDYAHRLQYEVDIDALIAKAPEPTRKILAADHETLARVLRTGDFLLLITGDRVQPRLVELMKPMLDRRTNLVSRFEMGLLSLALYRRGDQTFLVPNVVGAIARGERDICFEVMVKNESEQVVPAQVTLAAPRRATEEAGARLQAATWTRDTLLAQTREDLAPDHEATVRMLEELLELASRPPFWIKWGRGKKYATFGIFARGEYGDVGLTNADSNGWITLCSRDIASVLGEETTKREIGSLADSLDEPIPADKPYPYLPDISADPKRVESLCTWLRHIAEALATRNRASDSRLL